MDHHHVVMRAVQRGLQVHGIDCETVDHRTTVPADFDVVWSARNLDVIGGPVLILECGYINGNGSNYKENRSRFVSASWNKLHGNALESPPRPGDRWGQLGIEVVPWKTAGEYTLILSQVGGDASVPPQYGQVLTGFIQAAREHYGNVVVRQHPLVAEPARTLREDLTEARRAITWNSNSAVESVLAGVPTIAFNPGCIAWPVTSHRLGDPLFIGEREPWCYDLAYRQFTHDEIANGEAWRHLRYGIDA